MILFERRACAILYNLLRTRGDSRPFLMPANICSDVPRTFIAAQQPFDLVDIAETTLAIDTDQCLAHLRAEPQRYAGIIYVRTYGSERDPTPFFDDLRAIRSDLFIIDDKCLCRPDWNGEYQSPTADVTLFSTGHAKFVDLNEGGFAHVRDGVAYWRQPPTTDPWLDLHPPGTSWEEYCRRIADTMPAVDARKRALNAIYANAFPAGTQLPAEFQQWRFNIRVPDPERLRSAAFEAGLFLSRHYEPFASGFPLATKLHSEIVNLFNDRYFDEARALRMTELTLRHLR
jgi:hypothetical protein